ncbi:MAG: glycoside hydrolase family 2 protein [Bacteroidota bacterium]
MPSGMLLRFIKTVAVVWLILIVGSCSDRISREPLRIIPQFEWTLSNVNTDTTRSIVINQVKVPDFVQLELKSRNIMELFSAYPGADVYSVYDSIAKEIWRYQTLLNISDSIYRYSNIDLVFEGIDTFGEIYINDSLVERTDNMFRTWRIPAKRYLKSGNNKLSIMLLPVESQGILLKQKTPYVLPASDPVSPLISPFVRKAPYQFGWDWAPRCLTTGLWRPVSLEAYDGFRINSMHVRLVELVDSIAWMDAAIDIANTMQLGDVVIKIGDSFRQFRLSGNDTTVHVPFKVANPKLWWPNGMGKQNLYDFKALAFVDGLLLDSVSIKTGIRSSELVMEKDSIGTSFFFKINGLPVFAKGANYVPNGHFPGTEGDAKRLQLLQDAATVGMNMIRVWGGGVYEDNRFYQICDSLGLMVWQDFMFACAMYPVDSLFISNVELEAADQLRRLRNHPSIVLWCGNNESDVAWKNWGWQKQYGIVPEDSIIIRKGYEALFQDKLPSLVQKFQPGVPYVHSSPLSNWGKREYFNHLNMHYWGVWHGEEPIDSFKVNIPRFMSEYGMQSFPSYKKMVEANNGLIPDLDGSFIANRQKSYKGNKLLLKYIEEKYGPVRSVEELCYLSQLHQADAMTMAIESHRLNQGKCMGTLYWQLNDVWDGASWSTLESDGKWKAAHYDLNRLYGNQILMVDQSNDTVVVFGQQFIDDGKTYDLQWQVVSFAGDVISKGAIRTSVASTYKNTIFKYALKDLIRSADPSDSYLQLNLIQSDTVVASKTHFFKSPIQLKLMPPEIRCKKLNPVSGNQIFELSCGQFTYGLMVDTDLTETRFSSNYFHLHPNKPVVVSLPVVSEIGCENLKFRSFVPASR